MKSEQITNPDEGVLIRLHDVLSDRWAPVTEYPTLKVAIRQCGQLKLPPSSETGDYEMVLIGNRQGNKIIPLTPEVVWTYERPEGIANVTP